MNFSPATIQPFNPTENWPKPDMMFSEPVAPPAPKLTPDDMQAIFGPWAAWITSAAEVKSAPTDYVSVSLLCAASAALGNSRWAVPWDGWKEPPILWAMMVGNPSDGKSPAFDAVLDPIKEIETEMAENTKPNVRNGSVITRLQNSL